MFQHTEAFSGGAPLMSALPTSSREWHLVARPHGWPDAGGLRAARGPGARARRGPDPRPQPVLLRRPVHARPDERREVVHPALPARPAHGGRRGRRGHRLATPRASPSATTSCTASAGASTPTCDAKHAAKVDPSLAPLSAYLGVLGMPGLTAYAGLLRGRLLQGGRRRLRLRRGRCGRQPGRPDRQAQGRLPGHRLGRLRREGQAPRRGVRLRRRLQLQERPRRRAAARRPPPTASTSTSTTSAATTWRPRSPRSTCTAAPPSAA